MGKRGKKKVSHPGLKQIEKLMEELSFEVLKRNVTVRQSKGCLNKFITTRHAFMTAVMKMIEREE